VLDAQVEYKQNFLSAFGKQPDITDCEAAYTFLCCDNGRCAVFTAAKASLMKSYEELTALQLTANNSAMPSSVPTMSADDGKTLAEKLKKMTKEEKKQWAMQNAKNFMPAAAMHVNRDMDNQPVNEAVKCVTDRQAKDLQQINALSDFGKQLHAIEIKYVPQKEEALKEFKTVTHTDYDPASPSPYIFGEASDEQIAGFNKAVGVYQKAVLPIYNSEMKEKLKYVLQAEKDLGATYSPVEEKIALTNYADDAQEPSNKMHLIMGHMNVLQQVKTKIGTFETIISDFADRYSALMKIKSVKEVNKKEHD
jgi:hypothetical protein